MNDEIKKSDDQHEKVVIVQSDAEAQKVNDPLNIDWQELTNKELMAFSKKDLLGVAIKENVLSDLKDWQYDRQNKTELVKRLRSKQKGSNNQSKKEKKVSNDQTQDQEDILLLQSALIDIFTKGDPTNLDLYCTKTLQDNDQELITEDQAQKIKNIMIRFSIVHLIIRNNGGYKNIWNKAKQIYINLKQKYQERKAK